MSVGEGARSLREAAVAAIRVLVWFERLVMLAEETRPAIAQRRGRLLGTTRT
jgi:hypothetical protein